MNFEWDETKNRVNIEKHGLSFEQASRIFEDYTFDQTDNRFDYGERRTISIGLMDKVAIIVVVHTDRKGRCRIISARPAKRKERELYEQALRHAIDV